MSNKKNIKTFEKCTKEELIKTILIQNKLIEELEKLVKKEKNKILKLLKED